MSPTTLAARTGTAIPVPAGQSIKISNTYGSQVVDTWALRAGNPLVAMSMSHTRAGLAKLSPEVGDQLYDADRLVLMTLAEDTSPCRHDTLLAACDPQRYRMLGAAGPHANCSDNFAIALRAAGLPARPVPDPLNLFMNIPWSERGELQFGAPVGRPGDFVRLRAEVDVIVVLSACPQDMNAINGQRGPSDIVWEVVDQAT